MTTDDNAILIFFAGLGLMLLMIVWMLVNASNISNCLDVGMKWVDYDCVEKGGE